MGGKAALKPSAKQGKPGSSTKIEGTCRIEQPSSPAREVPSESVHRDLADGGGQPHHTAHGQQVFDGVHAASLVEGRVHLLFNNDMQGHDPRRLKALTETSAQS